MENDMSNERIAKELVAVARELTAKGITGDQALDDSLDSLARIMSDFSQVYKAAIERLAHADKYGASHKWAHMDTKLSRADDSLSYLVEDARIARNHIKKARARLKELMS